MKREDVEKAGMRYIAQSDKDYIPEVSDVKDAFVVGANWRINSIWHDVSETPKKDEAYIVIFNGNKIRCVFWSSICKWKEFMKIYEFNKWCYEKDLLPNVDE